MILTTPQQKILRRIAERERKTGFGLPIRTKAAIVLAHDGLISYDETGAVTTTAGRRLLEVLDLVAAKRLPPVIGTLDAFLPFPPVWEQTQLQQAAGLAYEFDKVLSRQFYIWPSACCFAASLLLAPLVRTLREWPVGVAIGTVAGHNEQRHAWIESPEGDIIDPTYGQFDRGPALRLLPAEAAADLGHQRALLLTPHQEDHFRAAMRPVSGDSSGWTPDCGIEALFGTEPRIEIPIQ